VILFVPRKLIISYKMAFESPIGKLMWDKDLHKKLMAPRNGFMAAFLLQEKAKDKK
jgi:hypothetical protein